MAVRNVKQISTGRKPKPIPVIHFIPPAFLPIYKLEIIGDDGVAIDFTDLVEEGNYSDGITNVIGDFTYKILDPNNTIGNKISEFGEVRIYMDYGSDAVTQRFTGIIESQKNVEDIYLTISGRSVAMITTGTHIIYSSNGLKARSVIVKEIIQANFPSISIASIEDDLEEIEVDYFEIPFWDVVRDICKKGTRDAYITYDLIFNYFATGSRLNTTEAIVEDVNLVKAFEYGVDTDEMITEARAYGAEKGGLPVFSTSDRDTSNTKGIVKQMKIDNTNAINETQTTILANAEAAANKTTPSIGKLRSLLLPTLLPGEKLRIANPINKLSPEYYEIESFNHMISARGLETDVIIKKQKVDLPKILKQNLNFQNDTTVNPNPFNLDESIIYDFSTSEGTFNNTQRVAVDIGAGGSNVLKTISGNTGSWTSPNIVFSPKNITALEFRLSGNVLGGTPPEGTKIEYSLDGGIVFNTWAQETITVDAKGQLQIRVNLSSSETEVKGVAAYFSLD